MGLKLTKELVSRGVVVFQRVHETAQGGFTLDPTNLLIGATLLAGTVIGFDESTRKAVVVKSATLQAAAGATDTTYRVGKGHVLKVGDILSAKTGSKAFDITAIDTTAADYDVVTLSATLGSALAAGVALFQAGTTGATAGALIAVPKGLLYEDTEVAAGADLAVVLRGTVYARRAPGASADVKAALPLIIYSQSY